MKNKLALITMLFTLLVIGFTGFYVAVRMEYETIEFEDPAFEQAVLELLNQEEGPLYRHQVSDISTLNLSNKQITNLSGIEAFPNLRILNLENNHVNDLTPLKELNKLEILNLRNNQIVDLNQVNIQALKDIETLKELNLRHNVLVDETFDNEAIRLYHLDPIKDFIHLERLILRDNDIASLTALENMTHLTYLDVSQNPIDQESFETLSTLFQLSYLNLRETNIRDLSVLTSLQSLSYLNLHSNINIESIEPIKHMIYLETLILENVPIKEDIIHLSSLSKLSRLNLRNTQIESLKTLEDLMNQGALQDQIALGIYAEVDLRDNPIPIVDEEASNGYNGLKDYWENITYRSPYLLPLNPTHEIFINEFSTSNGDTLADYDGDYSDWIELYNPNDEPVDLTGYFLSDDSDFPLKWQFPEGSIIQANGYLLVFASAKDKVMANHEIHTSFALARSGEPIVLTKNDRTSLVDQIYAQIVPRNSSFGRSVDGGHEWVFFDRFNMTPGSSNDDSESYDLPEWYE
ncbi:MAG: leucine-rich repeat domain-containing protein [Candidatus Izemoplasmataceae bacterium]